MAIRLFCNIFFSLFLNQLQLQFRVLNYRYRNDEIFLLWFSGSLLFFLDFFYVFPINFPFPNFYFWTTLLTDSVTAIDVYIASEESVLKVSKTVALLSIIIATKRCYVDLF